MGHLKGWPFFATLENICVNKLIAGAQLNKSSLSHFYNYNGDKDIAQPLPFIRLL